MKSYTGKGYTIYCHENRINGKIYIGQTRQKRLTARWSAGAGYVGCPHFNSAIKKYGWENFEHTILKTGLTKEEADAYEKLYISFFSSNDPKYGYNIQKGGASAGGMSPEGAASIREKKSGLKAPNRRPVVAFDCSGARLAEFPLIVHSAQHYGISESALRTHLMGHRGTCHGMIFRYLDDVGDISRLPPSEVFRPHEKPSLRRPKPPNPAPKPVVRKPSPRIKPVAQYDAAGNYLRSYASPRIAADELGVNITAIYAACKHNHYTCGCLWRYDTGDHSTIVPPPVKGQFRRETGGGLGKSVNQIDSQTGAVIASHVSVRAAARSCGCDRAGIMKVLSGKKKTCGGYAWEYCP